jgi:hypothetical protein
MIEVSGSDGAAADREFLPPLESLVAGRRVQP